MTVVAATFGALSEVQLMHAIMLFPLSLSGTAQRWFASLDPSRRRTWANLGQEFIRQYSFNTIVDVSRRELEALRRGWMRQSLHSSPVGGMIRLMVA